MNDGGDTSGGAYVGSRLNMPSNTRFGKLSAEDTKLLNKADNSEYGKELAKARAEGIVPRMTKEARLGIRGVDAMPGSEYKKGGKVKKMAAGGMSSKDMCYGGSVKKMAAGGMTSMGKVKTNPGNINGIAERGLTKGKVITMSAGGSSKKKYC